jgi:hypothetical protein
MSSGHHRFLPVLLLAAEATKSRLKSSAGSQYAAVHSLACCYSEDETPLMQVSTEVDNALAHLPCRIHVAHLITAHLVTSKIISHVSTAPSIPDSTHNVYCLGTSGLVLKHCLIPCRKLSASPHRLLCSCEKLLAYRMRRGRDVRGVWLEWHLQVVFHFECIIRIEPSQPDVERLDHVQRLRKSQAELGATTSRWVCSNC